MSPGQTKTPSITSPEQIWQDLIAPVWKSQALIAAMELDFCSHIAAGNNTAQKVAAAAGTSERGTRMLLDALCGMGYLKKAGQGYRLQPGTANLLVRGKPLYMGDNAMMARMLMGVWSMLPDAVRNGAPVTPKGSEQDRQAFFAKLVPSLFAMNFTAANAAVKRLPAAAKRRIKRILDIGAGAAAWSIPFAKAIRGARVTVVDYPAVADVAREFTKRWGVADRYDYLEGDFRQIEFEAGRYDVAILGHIVHGEGPELGQRLLKRTCDALNDGGMLLIGEFVPNDDRSGPATPLLFALNMLINTEAGDVFTMREYRGWLKQAGFRKVQAIPAPHVSPLILATK